MMKHGWHLRSAWGIGLILAMTFAAQGGTVTLTTADGLGGVGPWMTMAPEGFISSDVTAGANGLWHYSYGICVDNGDPDLPGLVYFILELDPSITADDLKQVKLWLNGEVRATWDSATDSNDLQVLYNIQRLQMPDGVYGLLADRFDVYVGDDPVLSAGVEFDVSRAPAKGNVYVRGERASGKYAQLWNTGLGQGSDFLDVPGSNVVPTGHVPEPLTMLGLLGGALGIAGYLRRR